ncbi:MAG: tetratricopeptide repeat protein, partial [Verrucomicrobiae bacterium]|nr:tetratricopeptide repeat protein [Verrucomicrobiae bacterium]
AIAERLAASDPTHVGWQRDLYVSLDKLGDLAVAQGDLAGATRRFTECLAIAERLAARDPDNAVWQRDLSFSYYRIAYRICMPKGQWDEALPLMVRSLDIAEKLAMSDPTNVMWQQDARLSRQFVGEIRAKLGR